MGVKCYMIEGWSGEGVTMPPDLTPERRPLQDPDIRSPLPSCGSAEYTSTLNGGGLQLTQGTPAITSTSHGSRVGQVASEARVTTAAGVGTSGAALAPVVRNTYLLTPKLRKAFSSVGATNCAYSFREVLLLLKKYLYSNVHLFDPIDRNYINCKSDPLETAFGVTRFHFTDVRGLISQNIITVQPAKGCTPNQENQPVPDSISSSVCGVSNDSTCRLSVPPGAASCIPVSESQLSQGTQNSPESVAAPRTEPGSSRACGSGRALSGSGNPPPPAITCPDIPDSCSDAETVFSVQGYETEYCRNTEFESSEEEDVEEVNSETFEEYELPSDDGNDEKKEFSDSDSTIDDVEIALFYTLVQDDLEEGFWADDDSDTDEDHSDDYDPECVSDRWDCLTCGLKNKPFVRYCSKCWQLRKNWLPDRPRKRKRKPRPKKRNLRKAMASNSSEQQSSSKAKTSCIDHRTRLVSESSADDSSQAEDLTRTSSMSTTASTASCSSTQDSGFSSQDMLEPQDFPSVVEDTQQPKTSSSRKRRSSSIDDYRSSKRSKGEESEDDRSPRDVDKLAVEMCRFISSSEGKTWLRSQEGAKCARSLRNSTSYQEARTKLIAEQISRSTPGTTSEVSMLCSICFQRPKNASIIHGKLAHQATCYQCAKRLLNEGARCPVCRRKIHMVCKQIVA